jgi:haloalkane dehalogenase
MRKERRVVAPDHIGCGLSDKPQDWSYRLDDHVDNLSRLVEELDLRDITLGVHDWGGAIGLGMAVRHPERIRRLLIFNTAAFRSGDLPLRLAVCRWPVVGALAVRGLNAFSLAATFMATERGLSGDAREGYLAPYGSWHDRIAVHRFVQDIPFETDHPSYPTLVEIENGLATLADRPTLIVWGERDWVFTPAFRKEFERRFPGARSVPVADAGHLVVEDAPERVLEELRAFLAAT